MNFEKITESFISGNQPKIKLKISTSESSSGCFLLHSGILRCFKLFYIFYVKKCQTTFLILFLPPICASYAIYFNIDDHDKNKCCLRSCTGIFFFFDSIPVDGIELIISIYTNTQNYLMLMRDKITLPKTFVIDTVNEELKNKLIASTKRETIDRIKPKII